MLYVALSLTHWKNWQSTSAGHVSTTMNLWSVDQTKASFLGITTHWINIDSTSSKWTLQTKVIAFQGISGLHTGDNIGHYFMGLCEQVGLISMGASKVRPRFFHVKLYWTCNSFIVSLLIMPVTMTQLVKPSSNLWMHAKSFHLTHSLTACSALHMSSI